MIEDKRRRNTAASARFRLKKKARAVNLERTVSDLEGRANDLEKEASELRRENTFLKNLIMQRATRRRGGGHRDQQEGPSSRPDQSDSGSEEGDESTDSEEARASRQKGKSKGKGKQKESDAGE
ncbi:hypothetical protein AURDEDRAFT_50523 [Auricularia subglabra TFB-10046 SS5]|nr:hypothetical protein AURDEDRAFT_50523 [Auricularia subglabra TFB-10046 SS5]